MPGDPSVHSAHACHRMLIAARQLGLAVTDSPPFRFDEFFGNCSVTPGCNQSQIDFIAFHDYQGDPLKIISKVRCLTDTWPFPLASCPVAALNDRHPAFPLSACPVAAVLA